MFRYRSTKKHFSSTAKTNKCPFCELEERGRTVKQLKCTAVIRNIFPYDLWEFRNVTDHLLVIPKRHVASLSQLNKAEKAEIMEIISEYEGKNYNIYSRSHISVQKTVPEHQHTHLIATDQKHARIAVFLRKPYCLFKR